MHEILKGVLGLVVCAGLMAAFGGWASDRPNDLALKLRWVGPTVFVAGLVGFIVVHFRRDQVPDYLRQLGAEVFERKGFCFSFFATKRDDRCVLHVAFQDRHSHACRATVALASDKKSGMYIPIEIECEPCGFGVASIAIPVPRHVQGENVQFDIGATVHRPQGPGKMLRFRDGTSVEHESDFDNTLPKAATILTAVQGIPVFVLPALVALSLPTEVSDSATSPTQIRSFWKLGDPPLSTSKMTSIRAAIDVPSSTRSKNLKSQRST